MVHPKDRRWWLCDDDVQTFVGKQETRVSGRVAVKMEETNKGGEVRKV